MIANRTAVGDVARGVAAIVGLMSLIAGVPLALWRWAGAAIPSRADLDAVRVAIDTGRVDDGLWLHVLAWVVWLLWAVVVISVVVEGVAMLRGRIARPMHGIAPLQTWVGRLVATTTLVTAALNARPVAALPDVRALAAATPPAVAPLVNESVPTRVESTRDQPVTMEYTVQRRDTLWSIAAHELGAGERWSEIAVANRGRIQFDGTTFDPEAPLRVGWLLSVPGVRPTPETGPMVGASSESERVSPDVTEASTAALEEATVTVIAGDTLWDLAETHLGDPLRWPEVFELNEHVPQPDGRMLTDPNCIDIGWQLQLPGVSPRALSTGEGSATPIENPSAPAEVEAPLATVTSIGPGAPVVATTEPAAVGTEAMPTTVVPPASVDRSPSGNAAAGGAAAVLTTPRPPSSALPPAADDLASPPDTTRLIAAGSGMLLLATGLVLAINRLRRQVNRARLPRRPVRLPVPLEPERELEIRRLAAPLTTTWVHAAISVCTQARRSRPGRVVGARIHDDRVEVLLDVVDRDPIVPWRQGSTGTTWELLATEDVVNEAPEFSSPGLVALGHDSGEVVCDLEALGWVACTGNDADRLIDAMVATLVVAPESEGVRVVRADRGDGSRADESVHAAVAHAASIAMVLRATGHTTTADARVARAAEDLSPMVVVIDATLASDTRAALLNAVGDGGRGLIVIERTDEPSWWTVAAAGGVVRVDRLELVVQSADPAVMAEVVGAAHLVADPDSESDPDSERDVEVESSRPRRRPEIDVMSRVVTPPVDERVPADEPRSVDEPLSAYMPLSADEQAITVVAVAAPPPVVEVEVRLIGSVEVVGGAHELDRRSTEFVVFLACHRDGAREDQIKTALWPDHAPASSSWTNRVSKTRKALGASGDGSLHLPHIATGGAYRLGPSVTSDLDRLEALLQRSDHEDAATAVKTLEAAIELVRGAPFSTSRGYDWAFVNGQVAYAEAVCADVAHRLAELYLERGDTSAALRAVQRGLLATPCNEVLYRDRMIAHDQAGNPEGVEAAMRDLGLAIESDDPESDVHPETLRVYEELRRQGARRAG